MVLGWAQPCGPQVTSMAPGLQQMEPAPLGAPCTGLGKPAEGNRPLPSGHGVDKARLCPSMPRFVPGSEVAGPGCPWGWGCWQAPCGDPCPFLAHPNSHWLACRWAGGETPLGQLCKCCQGFMVASCTLHRWDTAPGPPAPLPALVSHCKAGWQRAAWCPQPAVGWEGLGRDNRAGRASATAVGSILGHFL